MDTNSRVFWSYAWGVLMSPNGFGIAELHRAYEGMRGEAISGPVIVWKLYEGRL